MISVNENQNDDDTNNEKANKIDDLIDENEVEDKNKEKEKENENNISNGLNEQVEKGEEHIKEKPKLKKYVPKNEQDELKNRIINLEMKEKPNDQLKESYDFHMHDNLETSTGNGQIEKFKIPPELKKTFIIVMILAVLGVTLIVCGFIKAISDATPGGGIMFWVLGTVVIIPGGFYSYQFYKAKKAKEEYRRQDILDNIPQL